MTELIRRNGFGLGYGLMLAGLAILLAGFAVDSYLHAEDETLAAREGIFTLSNPGHLMVAVGLAMTVIGACLGPYSKWILPQRSRIVAFVVPATVIGVIVAVSFAWANILSDLSHDDEAHAAGDAAAHTDAGGMSDTATHDDVAAEHHTAFILPENQATVAIAESTMHEPPNTAAVTAENLAFAETFLADVRANLDKYKDLNVARADGYFRITQDLPLIGAHYLHPGYEGLDPAKPSMLLYHRDENDNWMLAGVSFQLPKAQGDDTLPESPLGGLAGWHYHTNLCFGEGGNATLSPDAAHCAGVFVQETGWLLHVWAWLDSPEGVFDHANSLLQ